MRTYTHIQEARIQCDGLNWKLSLFAFAIATWSVATATRISTDINERTDELKPNNERERKIKRNEQRRRKRRKKIVRFTWNQRARIFVLLKPLLHCADYGVDFPFPTNSFSLFLPEKREILGRGQFEQCNSGFTNVRQLLLARLLVFTSCMCVYVYDVGWPAIPDKSLLKLKL